MRNWAGNVRFQPASIAKVSNTEDIASVVRDATQKNLPIRLIGSRHSFSPLIQTDGIIIDPSNMRGLISVDLSTSTATFWAGTPISEVGPALLPHGLAISNQGDIDRQTLAGAVSTGTHGTGLAYGSLSSMVTALEYVDGHGEVHTVDQNSPDDLLSAFQVSLGALGILSKITLRCEPAFILVERRSRVTLDRCLADVPNLIKKHRHFEFFWFPYSDLVQIKTFDKTDVKNPRSAFSRIVGDQILEKALYRVLCDVTAAFPSLSRATSKFCGNLIPELECSDQSFRIYPSSRDVRFNEMEYAVPLERGIECFQAIRRMIEKEQIRVFFPVEFRVAAADKAWISAFHGRTSAIISLHVYKFTDQERYFRAAEEIFKSFDGRPHWGKVHNVTRSDIGRMYLNWPKFAQLRSQVDPAGIFLNPLLKGYFAL